MTKFKHFHDFLTAAAIESNGRLTQLRRLLREAGLVSSGGQGYASKPLEVSDVTNIFLGIVAPDQLNHVAAVVTLYRSATIVPHHSKNCEPWPFDNVESSCALGEFLDRFFEGLLHNRINPDWPWTNLEFRFDVVDGNAGASASLWFDDGNQGYTAKFSAFDPTTLAQIEAGDAAVIEGLHRPSVHHYASVRDEFLRPLVDFTVTELFPGEFNPDD